MKTVFRVTAEFAGRRLDVVLAGKAGHSRSYWSDQIKAGRVLVGGETIKPSYLVALHDKVSYRLPVTKRLSITPPDLKIAFEDNDLMVVEKPAGLLTHPVREVATETSVAEFARSRVNDTDKLRPGIVHRLDRDTSGLMILAKNPVVKTYLQNLFRRHEVRKTYIALVQGHPKHDQATIELPLGRSAKTATKRRVVAAGRPATTKYEVIGSYPGYSLVKASPLTGRTHQLRVHLNYIGHPIAGDRLYAGSKPPFGLKRQFLHATRLEFISPAGKTLKIDSPLPPELATVIAKLEKSL